jgi:phage gpG-like protein
MNDVPAEKLVAECRQMAGALERGSFAPAFRDSIELAHKSIGQNFAAEAAPHGAGWPPRKEEGDGHPLLIESGELFQAATSDFGSGSVNMIGDREASTGVDPLEVPYAATQNFGDAERNIPAREFEDPSDAALDEMAERLADEALGWVV